MALSKEEIKQVIDACVPIIKAALARDNPALAKKLYSKRAFERCLKATGQGVYIPYQKSYALERESWEGPHVRID